MNFCDENYDRLSLYLDGELSEERGEELRVHLLACADCKAALEDEQVLSRILRESRPLYTAPTKFRERVEKTLQTAPSRDAPERLYPRMMRSLAWPWKLTVWRAVSLRTVVAAITVSALCVVVVPPMAQQVRAATYVRAAMAAHHSYEDGNVRLGVQSNVPGVVTAWLAGRVAFHFQLPAAQSVPGRAATYRLAGASVLNYKGKQIALVVYEMQKRKISLLIAPSDSAVVVGGEEVHFGSLTFHYRSNEDFQVITWSNHGLAYALVSPRADSAQESCMVCHQDMADHGSFSQLSHRSLAGM